MGAKENSNRKIQLRSRQIKNHKASIEQKKTKVRPNGRKIIIVRVNKEDGKDERKNERNENYFGHQSKQFKWKAI